MLCSLFMIVTDEQTDISSNRPVGFASGKNKALLKTTDEKEDF